MTSPDSGRSRPLRVAGLVLLGVAVGALLVGLVSLGGNGGDGDGNGGTASGANAPPDPSATGPSATDPSATDSAAPTTEAPAPTPEPTTAPPAPPVTTQAPAPPPQPEPRAPVRVYNNSTVTGLAADAAADFRSAGWQVDETANYSSGIIPTSTVYFRPGTEEEAAARALGNRFKLRVEPRFDGIAGSPPGLIVIVTNDYGSK